MGFRGSYAHAFDSKGRVAIPVRFRDELQDAKDDRLVITRNFGEEFPCLDVYPHPAWLEFEAKIQQQERFDPKVARFRRFYFSEAQDCSVDRQGRILVSPRLREYAQLKRDVLFVSDFDKFQIWDPQIWEQVERKDRQALIEDPNNMKIGF